DNAPNRTIRSGTARRPAVHRTLRPDGHQDRPGPGGLRGGPPPHGGGQLRVAPRRAADGRHGRGAEGGQAVRGLGVHRAGAQPPRLRPGDERRRRPARPVHVGDGKPQQGQPQPHAGGELRGAVRHRARGAERHQVPLQLVLRVPLPLRRRGAGRGRVRLDRAGDGARPVHGDRPGRHHGQRGARPGEARVRLRPPLLGPALRLPRPRHLRHGGGERGRRLRGGRADLRRRLGRHRRLPLRARRHRQRRHGRRGVALRPHGRRDRHGLAEAAGGGGPGRGGAGRHAGRRDATGAGGPARGGL
ncbi:MAG: Pyruvate:Oxaloacetate transcarboxylase domain protein, partial [uncultured Acetobacteraceae bacterium]